MELERFLDIGIKLSSETDSGKLLDTILSEAIYITNADAGSLYMCNNQHLDFKILKNNTLGIYESEHENSISLPAVPRNEDNICAYSAINNKFINIEDVYNNDEFNFSGPREYDKITGYHTKSMIVLPLSNNKNEVIGVIQLINCQDDNGHLVAFNERYEKILLSLASQAAIALTNSMYSKEIKELFYSLVTVLSTAIEKATPYNNNHTKNLVKYIKRTVKYINSLYKEGKNQEYFNENREEQLIMSAWLHDIGKLIVPSDILNKSTRLGKSLDIIINRLDYIKAMLRISYLESKITEEQWRKELQCLDEVRNHILLCNSVGFIDNTLIETTNNIAEKTFININGDIQGWLTEEEIDNLKIIKGTLNVEERRIIEQHAEMTTELLNQIKFNKEFESVPIWAGNHHEYLNGTGYPKGLTEEELSFESRLLCILDIFEALTSKDRPYKKALPIDVVFKILGGMVMDGKLDGDIVNIIKDMVEEQGLSNNI